LRCLIDDYSMEIEILHLNYSTGSARGDDDLGVVDNLFLKQFLELKQATEPGLRQLANLSA
jgi:hypothetical protein